MRHLTLGLALALACAASPVHGQSNANPAIDVKLGAMSSLTQMGRVGAFPNGTNGLSMSTTSCNDGTATVPWLAPGSQGQMQSNHPFIAFLVARDTGVRFEQISDRSYVKHGFFALSNSQCTPCQGGSQFGTFLGIGCSDTYGTDNNGDRFWLGPAAEIDPWLGQWDPVCSYFDRGDPAVSAPQDCDGQRSLTASQAQSMGPVSHRVTVTDKDLQDSGPERFYYQAQYVVRSEPEAARDDNVGWREVQPSFSSGANQWSFSNLTNMAHGSVLEAWQGAFSSSAANGADDGRVWVAVKVTGPVAGLWHYEYAVHNRDNSRGVGQLRIPICAEAQVLAPGFADVDRMPANNWSFARGAAELVWTENGGNAVAWNTIYNFWFDSDASPVDGVSVELDQLAPGPGATTIAVASRAPLGLYNVDLGPGCSFGTPPRIFADGTPPHATIDNSTLLLRVQGAAPNAFTAVFYGIDDAQLDVGGGCFAYVGIGSQVFVFGSVADAAGATAFSIPIPDDPGLEGIHANFQVMELDPLGGPFLDDWDLSNGQRLRIGDFIPSCP